MRSFLKFQLILGHSPTKAARASFISPAEIPFKYNQEIISFRLLVFLKYLGVKEEVKWIGLDFSDSLSLALGTFIFTSLTPVAPGSNNNIVTTRIGYSGLTTTYTDGKGRVKTVIKNIAGKVATVIDPAGATVQYQYDALGRMIERTEEEGTTTWIYDQAERGVGKVYEVQAPGYLKRYRYDELGRPSSTTTAAERESHTVLTAYDDLGRVDFQTWPGDFRLYRRYNQHGYLSALQSPQTQSIDGFDKEDLKVRMEQALQAATEAQRLAWESRVAKLRLDKKAETYRKIAVLLQRNGELVDDLRQASSTLNEYGNELGEEVRANEAQAAESYRQAEEISAALDQTGGSEADSYQSYIYHQQMTDLLAEMADAVLTYDDENFLTKNQRDLASLCVDQVQYHQKQAIHYQEKVGDVALNGLDQIQMMVDEGNNWITYWRAGSYDAAGRLTSEVNGNGLYTEKVYNPAGEISQILSRFGYEDPIRNLSYQYDENHNVTARYDHIQDIGEEFDYDALDRLTDVRGGGNLQGGEQAEIAEKEDSEGDVKQLSFSGFWSGSGGRNPNSSRNMVYSFSLSAKSMVTIDLTSHNWFGRIDTYLYLINSSGQVIAKDDDGGSWLFSNISMVLEEGYYRVVAATYRNNQVGHFDIRLDSRKPPASKMGEWERSGGRKAQHSGNPVIPIVVEDNALLQIDLMSSQDAYLYLLNSEKHVIARNDDGGAGYNSRLRVTLATGQYYLVAGTYRSGRSGNFQMLLSAAARFGTLREEVALGQMTSTQSFDYDAQGNMTSNSTVGDYQYDTSRHQAIKQAGNNVYEYDANGNVILRNGATIVWASFNKPSNFVQESGVRTQFKYAPDRSRYLKLRHNAEGEIVSRTFYMGKGYEKTIHADGSKTHKYFIYANGKLIATHSKTEAAQQTGVGLPAESASAATEQIRYLHYDNLGSVDTVTNGSGAIVERMRYGAFGKRLGDSAALFTNRGFTGHEHIDEMGLIHMNGRVYDPLVGRFLSADPYVQAPYNSQSHNRYSYVLNNPLRYVDPSGYFWNKVEKWWQNNWKTVVVAVVVITVVVCTGGTAAVTLEAAMMSGFYAGAAGGLVGGYLATGTLEGAMTGAIMGGVVGAFSAGLFYGAGSLAGNNLTAKIAAHGMVGGIRNVAMGQNFGQGFMAAAVTAGASPHVSTIESQTLRVFASAAIGGTAAQLGGGKFANGAVTGAYSRMFNEEYHPSDTNPDPEPESSKKSKYGIWIEGSSPGENPFHVSLGVGDPNGENATYSFMYWRVRAKYFDTPFFGPGVVYEDKMKGGKILEYYSVTEAQKTEIHNSLKTQPFIVEKIYMLPFKTCIQWSYDTMYNLANQYNLDPSPSPSR